ncbi:TetR/AcrR family transcriptional regulator [Nocardioides mangrovicus]|uniref:TetR/AcrR family transcriptional regulator n=1 Tax=Nocardioides mangrovicus TaxID=2478913 RepID=UPI0018E078E6|nr:TetR family transcriptional regulator C-terminal domain-containing protein [Nocardioides mangrovicus]
MEAAAKVALIEGLECITLRRVADLLDVRPGLVGHYFPVAEDLVAETFGTVAEAELLTLIPPDDTSSALERMARFLTRALSPEFHDVNRLWLNARHLARYRPTLRDRVILQGDHWRDTVAQLIDDGVGSNEFGACDSQMVSLKILAVIDGLSADLNADPRFPASVMRMAVDVAEQELGLHAGDLGAPPTS